MLPLPVHISAAAELDGGEEFVKTARALGATFGLAHSDATYDEAMMAIDAGATRLTHTFNAMRPINHREPGILVAALTDNGINVDNNIVKMIVTLKIFLFMFDYSLYIEF